MARSRGYWKRKDSRRARRILNRSLDVITQIGTAKLAVLMMENTSAHSLIGSRRELSRIDKMTQEILARDARLQQEEDDYIDALYEQEAALDRQLAAEDYRQYLAELQDDYGDQVWDSRYDELESHYDWNY